MNICQSQKNQNAIDIKNISFYKNLSSESFSAFPLDNTFTVIKTIDHMLILIYSNEKKAIISYNLIDNQKIAEIKNAHDSNISNFRHYLDNIKKRDLILSISYFNSKIWNVQNWDCLLIIKNKVNIKSLFSGCFLNCNNQIYILIADRNLFSKESIKVFDFNGNKIKALKGSIDETYFIDSYNDNKNFKDYIITANFGYVKSYDYNNNELYHKYYDNDDNRIHSSIIINYNEKNTNLIESSQDGNIRIWNFHSGILMKKIKVNSGELYGICLWDNNHLFAGCFKEIKLIDIENKNIINTLKEHNHCVLTLKKIIHPNYGECLISQGNSDNNIKLWIIKN